MRKITITESQAKMLALKENDEPSGLKASGTALGPSPVRVVIVDKDETTQLVPKLKDKLIQKIMEKDPSAKIAFFPNTGKIVGTVSQYELKNLAMLVKTINPNISFEQKAIAKSLSLKEGKKNKVKITKEQYNRIFASKLIKESHEPQEGGDIQKETMELIKYLYRKNPELSPFWEKHGLTYDEICKKLTGKKLIVQKAGGYELSKTLGDPNSAIKAVENELSALIGEPKQLETEDSSDGIQTSSQREDLLSTLVFNNEIAIMKAKNGDLYVLDYSNVPKEETFLWAVLKPTNPNRDEDNLLDTSAMEDYDIDSTMLSAYVNNNLQNINKGIGVEAFNNGVELVKIDDALRQELLGLYDKDKSFVRVLGGIQEITGAGSSGAFTGAMNSPVITKQMPEEEPLIDETTTAGSSGQYDANAFSGIGRNGSFKTPKQPKAMTKTQFAGGGFVELGDCTKMNNKPAGSGCSTGAVDNVVKVKKSNGNISAPSLKQ